MKTPNFTPKIMTPVSKISKAATQFEEQRRYIHFISDKFKLKVNGVSQKGIRKGKALNDDYILVKQGKDFLFVGVADGVGGGKRGDFASLELLKMMSVDANQDPVVLDKSNYFNYFIKLDKALHQKICDKDYAPSATTMVTLSVNKKKALVLNLGDSRAYLQTDDEIQQITIDQTYKNAKIQPKENIHINSPCQMFGLESLDKSICNDLKAYQTLPLPKNNDLFLLCSDGLSNFLADDFIQHIIKKHKNSPKECLNNLIDHAIKNGSDDDISIILVQYHKGLTFKQKVQKFGHSIVRFFDDKKNLKWLIFILSILVIVLLILQFSKDKPLDIKPTNPELTTERFKLNQDDTNKTDEEDNY